jgi:hypothetical protein
MANITAKFDEAEKQKRSELRRALEDFGVARRTGDLEAARDAIYLAARLASELPDATVIPLMMLPVLRHVIEAAKETYDRL